MLRHRLRAFTERWNPLLRALTDEYNLLLPAFTEK
jgi:hypothetical protein